MKKTIILESENIEDLNKSINEHESDGYEAKPESLTATVNNNGYITVYIAIQKEYK